MLSVAGIYGGAEVYFLKLSKILSKHYNISTLVACPRLYDLLRKENSHARIINSGVRSKSFYLRAAIELYSTIKKINPDLIYLNGQAELYFCSAIKAFNIPIVATRHTEYGSYISLFKRLMISANIRSVGKTICVSSLVKSQLSKVADASRLCVVPNWLEHIPEDVERTPYLKTNRFHILYVGRLIKAKGIFELIKAIKGLEHISLDVVGEGPDSEELADLAQGSHVTFHGFQFDCTPFYKAADLLVFPSHGEGQGLVPMEAMAQGLPCLLSDIPTGIEAADGGKTAELFTCKDIESLKSKIELLKSNEHRLTQLSRNGRLRAHKHYSQDTAETLILGVINEQLSS